jgi:PAS domain S-box-containing protein
MAWSLPRGFVSCVPSPEVLTHPIPDQTALDAWTRSFIDASPDPFVVFDGSGRIVRLNASLERLLKEPQGEMVGRSIAILLPGFDAQLLSSLESAPSGLCLTLEARTSSGTGIPVDLVFTPLRAGTAPLYLGRMELLANGSSATGARAQLANLLQEEFLMTLSHELRSPLQAILSWSQLLRSGSGDPPTSKNQGLDAIERNIRRQVEVIDDVLELSQIVSSDFRLNLRGVRLGDLVEAAVADASESARSKEVRMTCRIDPDEALIRADVPWLRRLVAALLSNALKFTGSGGSIQIELTRLPSWMQLTVSDESPEGNPGPHVVHDPFRHGEPSSTHRFHDRGVALLKVQRLAELQGGLVFAESRGFGRGARFVVSLPVGNGD